MSFTRSKHDCKIAGICGALGDHLDIDPLWIRVFFALFLLCTPFPIGIIYFLIWILTSKEK